VRREVRRVLCDKDRYTRIEDEALLPMAVVATGLGVYEMSAHAEIYVMLAAACLWVAYALVRWAK